MSEETDQLKKELKEKEAQIKALEEKLRDRNPAFNAKLLERGESRLGEIKNNLGKTIFNHLGPELFRQFEHKPFYVESCSSLYMPTEYIVRLPDNKHEENLKRWLEEQELNKFMESLDNFAWAVNNGQG